MTHNDADAQPVSPRTARNVLVVLTFVNLFNYIDRYIVPGVAVSLEEALHLNEAQVGFLATGFIVVYAIASPRFGELGDSRHRPRLIALGVAIWSIATVLGGVAIGFVSLLLARAVLGIGEAAYGSIAPSLLADSFPRARRGRVFSIFYAAIPIGSALGYLIAGGMDKHFGWRSAFFVAGVPGLLLAGLLLKLPEVQRGMQDAEDGGAHRLSGAAKKDRRSTYAGLVRNPRYAVTVLGYAAYTFAMGALAFWMPSFLTLARGVPRASADFQIGIIAVATGFIGTFAGGWIGDYFLRYTRHAYLLVSGIATLAAVPFTIMALTAHQPRFYFAGLVVAELLMFASTGPVNSAIINYVAPTERATAMALSILTMHLLGDAPSPFIVGWLSVHGRNSGDTPGVAMQHALMILPFAILLSGLIWTAGGLRREKAR